ncbi:exopolysaccharide biosynthesis protein [Sphingomonas sp. Leaf23]|uniref:GNVR domain-containing protein n=1 Tax=Sphingomonas sp. Leaf23 TaxID=1735689 RepID=UPI0006F76FA7|nr:GNVR domain-containing protein [Sphingomonas sp. Leaf23]KQM85355.1 exopolysaccharide biosynthesis protein [Sphingomonas sp. Leaf23]
MSFNLADLWQVVRTRLLLILLVGGVVFALAATLALIQPRQYRATSSLLVDLAQTDQSEKDQQQSAAVIDSIIGTQVSVLRSELVLSEVATKSGLIEKPNDPVEAQRVRDEIAKNLSVDTDRQSNVITIGFIDRDPETAARVANLFADTFLAKQVELRVNPARVNARWYDQRTAEVRERFEAAQRRLTDFQRANGIIGVDRMDVEAEKLKSLSAELTSAEAAAAEARSKAGGANMPEVNAALSVQGLQQQVAIKSAEAAELARTLGPNHPEMVAAQAQVATLRAQLAATRGIQSNALSAASGAAVRREADLRSRLAEQQSRMLRMSGTQDQLSVLQRDVDAARQTYETVRQRLNDAALKSEVSRANTTILDRAVAPLLPFKPNVLLWLLGGLVFGGVLGCGLALILEIASPRARSVSGLSKATELDVLADFTDGSSDTSTALALRHA